MRNPLKSIKRTGVQWMEERIESRVRRHLGLAPITEIADDDIFIVSYPKSGSTWFRDLLTGIVYGLDTTCSPYAFADDLVPDVHAARYYKRYQNPTFFKSHHLPKPEYKHVVYILRDGRDAMGSYYHYLRSRHGKEIDFLTMVQTGEGLICKWHEHVEQWLANPYHARLTVLRYENLQTDPVGELQRFCAFAGLERDDAFLRTVSERSSFENMRQKEVTYGWDVKWQWPEDKFFIRRGQVGSYKDEMPADVLEAFLRDAGDTLCKCNYL